MIIIVDSDGLIGIFSKEDPHHKIAHQILKSLIEQKARMIYPATTIAETTAVLQIRLHNPSSANQILDSLRSGNFDVEPVDQETLINAIPLLEPSRSKHHTLFDAIVAATAEKYHADAIFSFDKFYKSKGFKLASEL